MHLCKSEKKTSRKFQLIFKLSSSSNSRPYLTISVGDRLNAGQSMLIRPINITKLEKSKPTTAKNDASAADTDELHGAASGITIPVSKSVGSCLEKINKNKSFKFNVKF